MEILTREKISLHQQKWVMNGDFMGNQWGFHGDSMGISPTKIGIALGNDPLVI